MSACEFLAQQLITGLTNGMLIALIALGYTLVYGIIEMINFAHGDVYMLGTFASLTAVQVVGLRTPRPNAPPAPETFLWLAGILIAAMVATALLNVVIERLAYRPLRRAPRLAPFISAIGMSFILMNVGLLWKGAAPLNFPNYLPRVDILNDVFHLGTAIYFSTKDLFVIAVTVPLVVALQLFVLRTRIGKAMRATAQDREAAQLMGININRTIAMTFLLGGALAGAAGLISGLYNNTAVFTMGFQAGLSAFTAAVLGGIGSLPGALLGGLFLGVVAALSDGYIGARWTPAVVFGMLVLALVFRPTGFLGRASGERA
ncbi:MAG TPA: branched-chain amino acid ABC transporter permease [Chloroflexota bacterium]|nr:branched-chain amino acid ABC transporter permease [Chloroflexota bacterium]